MSTSTPKVVKDQSYHEAAVSYNKQLFEHAKEVAETIDHPIIRKWCLAVANQHKFHLGRHEKALKKLEGQSTGSVVDTEDGGEDTVIDDVRTVHRSAESGQFVTKDEADESPATTVQEHVEVPPSAAEPVDAYPDPELAAEPVDAGVAPESDGLTEEEKADLAKAQRDYAEQKEAESNE